MVALVGDTYSELVNKTRSSGLYIVHVNSVVWVSDPSEAFTFVWQFGPPRASCHGNIEASFELGR